MAELEALGGGLDAKALARLLDERATDLLVPYLSRRRWFGAKARRIRAVELLDWAALPDLDLLALWRIAYEAGPSESYFLPVVLRSVEATPPAPAIARLRIADGEQVLFDALSDPGFCLAFYQALAASHSLAGERGRFRFRPSSPLPAESGPPRVIAAEQSNTSVVFGQAAILKAFRRLAPGVNPDVEISRFLTLQTGFQNFPRALGDVSYEGDGDRPTLAFLQEFVPNQGDGWSYFLAGLAGVYGAAYGRGEGRDLVPDAARLGQVTGQLHLALASDPAHPDFAPQPASPGDVRHWRARLAADLDLALAALERRVGGNEEAAALLRRRRQLEAAVERFDTLETAELVKIRIHGDYHLGQVLRTAGDFVVIDFEGEPARSLEERRARQPAMKDVAGMVRSFNYAAWAGWFEHGRSDPALQGRAGEWDGRMRRAFWDGYRRTVANSPVLPADEETQALLLSFFELEKLVYELNYELNHRPDWLPIPLKGVLGVLERLEAP